jgi:hypothetical protein
VDHALAERGLSPAGAALGAGGRRGPGPEGRRRVRWGALVAGAPLEIVEEHAVPAALAPRDLDRLVNVLRDGTGTLGHLEHAAGGLVWRGAWTGHRLTATLASADGRTTVQLAQRMGRAAAGVTAASVAVVGGGVGPAVGLLTRVVLSMPAPDWGVGLDGPVLTSVAVAAGVASGLASLPVARAWVRRVRAFHAARLRTLGQLLAVRVGEAGDK